MCLCEQSFGVGGLTIIPHSWCSSCLSVAALSFFMHGTKDSSVLGEAWLLLGCPLSVGAALCHTEILERFRLCVSLPL